MRGRKPKLDNVIPMRPDDPDGHEALRLKATAQAVAKLRLNGLNPEPRKEGTGLRTCSPSLSESQGPRTPGIAGRRAPPPLSERQDGTIGRTV
jgi:hypothetical protein